MLLSNLSELWSAVGRWSVVGGCWLFVSGNFRTICHCMLLLPERLLLVVFIVFLLCSVMCYFFFFVVFVFFWVNSFTEKQLKRIIPTQICGHKLLMDSIEHDQKRGWPWVWMGRLEWDAGGGRGMSRQLSLCCEYKLCHKN